MAARGDTPQEVSSAPANLAPFEIPGQAGRTFPCQVYVKIIEAKNLPGLDKHGLVDPIVELYLGSERKAPLSTRVFQRSVSPRWQEEFVVNLPDNRATLTFHVWDYVRVLSNTEIGVADVDVSQLMPGNVLDLWLPLRVRGQTPEPGGPELHVFVHVTPLMASNPARGQRLSSFRLTLERATYYPGEVVRGCVVWNVGNPKTIRGVKIQFSGAAQTGWTEYRQQGKVRKAYHYRSYMSYFDRTAMLLGPTAPGATTRTESATSFFWPFQFILPAVLPSTFIGAYGHISYFIKAYIDIPFGFNKNVLSGIRISNEFASLNPSAQIVASGAATKGLFVNNMLIDLKISAPPVIYAGETVALEVEIDNAKGKKAVEDLQIQLTQVSVYFARRGNTLKRRIACKPLVFSKISAEKGVPGFPLPIAQKWRGTISIQVPKDAPSTIAASLSPYLSVLYTISATINTTGNFLTQASNTKEVPVYLSHRIPPPGLLEASSSNAQSFAGPMPQTAAALQFIAEQPAATVILIQPPTNYFQYLAPSPLIDGAYNIVGPTVPLEAFAPASAFQPSQEQLSDIQPEAKEFAQAYDPNALPFQDFEDENTPAE